MDKAFIDILVRYLERRFHPCYLEAQFSMTSNRKSHITAQ